MMHQSIYFVATEQTLSEYQGENTEERLDDLKRTMDRFDCDGLEVVRCGEDAERRMPPRLIRGVHMGFYSYWLDVWRGNRSAWLAEFGSEEVCEGFYGGTRQDDLLDWFRKDIRYAQAMKAEYLVFHVSDVTLEEVFTHRFHHTSQEVIDGAAEMINELLSGFSEMTGGPDDPYFLMENLQWPGLTMTDPELTERLLSQVKYPKKGIMLDLGHLMCANPGLDTEEEGLRFVHSMLDYHGELTRWIKGIHLHQSHSGSLIRAAMEAPPAMEKEYYARFAQTYRYLSRVDTHKPMTCPGTRELIQRIDPQFLTHEFLAKDRVQLEAFLGLQTEALKW